MNNKPITGLRKRAQIDSTNRQIIVWVGVASVIVVGCIVFAINFIQDISYQIKVNSALGDTASTLSTSVANIPNLTKSVSNLSTNPDLTLQNVSSYTDANGNAQTIPAQQVILYSMPTSNDPTSLASSLQNLLASVGVNATQIDTGSSDGTSGTATTTSDTSSNSGSNNSPTSQPISFTITLGGNPNDGSLAKTLAVLENTTRVITVNSITAQSGQTTIQATAYYTPKVNYQTGTQEVQP